VEVGEAVEVGGAFFGEEGSQWDMAKFAAVSLDG